jgi:hypothetical protein
MFLSQFFVRLSCVVVLIMLIKFLLKPMLKFASLMFIIRSAVPLYVAFPYEILYRSLPLNFSVLMISFISLCMSSTPLI